MKLNHPGQNQTIVTIENHEFYFSYNTCVAVRNEKGSFRIEPISKTTARHMTNLGIKDWPVITEEELNTYLPKILPPLSK